MTLATEQQNILLAYAKLDEQIKELTKKKDVLSKQIKENEEFSDFKDASIKWYHITRQRKMIFKLRKDVDKDMVMLSYPEAVKQTLDEKVLKGIEEAHDLFEETEQFALVVKKE